MQTTSIFDLFQCLCRRRLSGPLFDKELRIASRRRRGYALRFAYVMLLAMAGYLLVSLVFAWRAFRRRVF